MCHLLIQCCGDDYVMGGYQRLVWKAADLKCTPVVHVCVCVCVCVFACVCVCVCVCQRESYCKLTLQLSNKSQRKQTLFMYMYLKVWPVVAHSSAKVESVPSQVLLRIHLR